MALLNALLLQLALFAWDATRVEAAANAVESPSRMAEQVVACLPNSCINRRTTWQHMLDDVPSCLAVKRAWWSEQPPRMPVTLITQLSVSRLQALREQCATWGGPLAAAIYLPLHNPGKAGSVQLSAVNTQKLQTAVSMIDDLFKQAEADAAGTSTSVLCLTVTQVGACISAWYMLQHS